MSHYLWFAQVWMSTYFLFFQLRRRFKFVFASQHNSIVERAAFETVSTEIVNYSQICFRTLFKGAQKIHREGSFKESVFFGVVIKMDHYLSLKILHTNAKKREKTRLSYSKHQSGSLFNVSVVAFCDFRQRLWPLSGLDRRPY